MSLNIPKSSFLFCSHHFSNLKIFKGFFMGGNVDLFFIVIF